MSRGYCHLFGIMWIYSNSYGTYWIRICHKAVACLPCICFLLQVWFSKIQTWLFFACLLRLLSEQHANLDQLYFPFPPPFFMNLKKYDRVKHFGQLIFNSVLCLVSCSSKNQVPYFILNKECDQFAHERRIKILTIA